MMPGAGASVVGAAAEMPGEGSLGVSKRQFTLKRESELRCEVDWESSLTIRLLSGTAEVFGTELPEGRPISFSGGEKIAVYTWHGATIEVEGSPSLPDGMYVSDETPMVPYVNVHGVLNVRRVEACKANAERQSLLESAQDGSGPAVAQGPRVMLVGPTDSGKSALARVLLNYAARQGWKPTAVDLDVTLNSISTPGTLAAAPVEGPTDLLTPSSLEDTPLAFFYGHVSPAVNVDVYKTLVQQMAAVLEEKLAGDAEAASAGIVVNSMGWVEGSGYQILLHSIDSLCIDVVLVLGHEKLHSMLADVYADSTGPERRRVSVVKLPKSGGVVQRSKKYRQRVQNQHIKVYFEGDTVRLSPHKVTLNWDAVRVYRVGGGPQAPRSALPIGEEPSTDPLRPALVPLSRELVHNVLAVSWAQDEKDLLTSNVAGFICVTEVDVLRMKITYLAPSPGPLPNKYLLAGSITWLE